MKAWRSFLGLVSWEWASGDLINPGETSDRLQICQIARDRREFPAYEGAVQFRRAQRLSPAGRAPQAKQHKVDVEPKALLEGETGGRHIGLGIEPDGVVPKVVTRKFDHDGASRRSKARQEGTQSAILPLPG